MKLFRGLSVEAAELFDAERFDYVFVDADHSFDGCYNDLNLWFPKVRWWGILAIHDYCDYTTDKLGVEFGVKKAVELFLSQKKMNIKDEWMHVTAGDEFPTLLMLKGKRD